MLCKAVNSLNPLTSDPGVSPLLAEQLFRMRFRTYSTWCRKWVLISSRYIGSSIWFITFASVEGGGSVSASKALKKLSRLRRILCWSLSNSNSPTSPSATSTYIKQTWASKLHFCSAWEPVCMLYSTVLFTFAVRELIMSICNLLQIPTFFNK